MKTTSLTIALFLVALIPSFAQDTIIPFDKAYKRIYNISRLENERPVIDGRLDDSAWKTEGQWTEEFVQVTPYERGPNTSPTFAKLFYDDKHIYIGVICHERYPDRINRFIGNRDDNSLGDILSIAFDPYHDFRAAPEFNINAGGNKTDLVVTDARQVNLSWNTVWEGRTHVSLRDSLWSVEIRIPFSQLRYNQLKSDGIWGLHIRRVTRYNNEVQNWSLIPLKNNGHVFSFGEMHGMKNLPKAKGIEFLPYVLGKHRNTPIIPNSPYQTGSSWMGNVGADAKIALKDYTLDITINPDFGQVELDPSVMNLTTFETFYDEKRPFFLEGKHILDFTKGNDLMFYTRRIGASPRLSPQGIDNHSSFAEEPENVPIIGALKLTGTNSHGLTLGVVQTVTARTSLKTYRNGNESHEIVEPLTNYTVLRLQKNWKGNTLLGGMITSANRDLTEPHLEQALIRNAMTAGIDFTQYFTNRLYYIDAKAMFSTLNGSKEAVTALQQSQLHYFQRASGQSYLGVDPNRSSLNGTGGYVKLGRKGNARWVFSETFEWSSPGFDLNDMGYLRQTDQMSNETEIGYRFTDVWKKIRATGITFTQKNKWNYGGTNVGNDVSLRWQAMNTSLMELDFKQTAAFNTIDSRMLRGGADQRLDPWLSSYLKINSNKAKRLMFMLIGQYDYSTSHEFNTLNLRPSLSFRIGNCVYLTGALNMTFGTIDAQYITCTLPINPTPASQRGYFLGEIKNDIYGVTLKAQANITPDLSIQFYASPYTSVARYNDLKLALNPSSRNKAERYYEYRSDEVSLNNGTYTVGQGAGEKYSFANPDFSFNEFRSNLVVRWEYMRGSTLYFVWEHRMSNKDNLYRELWTDNLQRMFELPTYNTFMVKINYWFAL